MEAIWDKLIWCAGTGHFLILVASFQVPGCLNWRKELAKLSPLNRKLMWVYGGFTIFTILSFGFLTLLLHDELLRGDRAALALAVFIGLYWAGRIGVDFFYFKHSDWPRGRRFVVGHMLLNSLFLSLMGTYLALVVWHFGRRGCGGSEGGNSRVIQAHVFFMPSEAVDKDGGVC